MIAARASDPLIAEYKRLLLSEWKRDLPEQVLALLWACVVGKLDQSKINPLLALLAPELPAAFPETVFRDLIRRISEVTRFLDMSNLPALPRDYALPKRPSKVAWQASRLAVYLTLQASTDLRGELGFFKDLQSLAFQAAIHFVLPSLQEKHPAEHAILMHALVLFPLEYAASDSAHYSYLMGMLQGYLGNDEQRLHHLMASFRATPPEDHSYLTKAQELWSELLDRKQYTEAEKFLFSLHWKALPSQREEVEAMVVDGLRYVLANGQDVS